MSGPFIIDGPVLHFIRTTLDIILFEGERGSGGGFESSIKTRNIAFLEKWKRISQW